MKARRKARTVALQALYEIDCTSHPMDLVVEESIVLELKSVEEIHPIHEAQLLTYLRQSVYRVGLLINFNSTTVKQGIVRRVL